MTLMSLFNDFITLAMFLLAGFVVREKCKIFQKYFIPASVIGGIIALVLGPQVLGWVVIPKTFAGMSGVMINFIMAALVFGVPINFKQIRNYLDYSFMGLIVYGFQLGGGVFLGMMLRRFWKDLPAGWGCMGVFSFIGGHGTAAAVGNVFKSNGVEDNLGIGMILSTIGVITAIVFGMMIVNWGIRHGKTLYIKDTDRAEASFFGGLLPADKRTPVGLNRVSPVGINNIALQFVFIALCIWVGGWVVVPIKTHVTHMSGIPSFIYGIVGAMIIWPLMCRFKLDQYADKKTISSMSGFCLEIVIVSAIATIRIDLLTRFWLPILIYSAICVAITFLIEIYFCPRMCRNEWFEKLCMNFGQATGNTSTGLALLRSVDPNMQSSAADAHGVSSVVYLPVLSFIPAAAPLLCLQNEWIVVGIGAVLCVAGIVIGRIFFWQK